MPFENKSTKFTGSFHSSQAHVNTSFVNECVSKSKVLKFEQFHGIV